MLFFPLLTVFVAVFFTAYLVVPMVQKRFAVSSALRQQEFVDKIEPFVAKKQARELSYLFLACPVIFGLVAFFAVPQLSVVLVPVAVVGGFMFPYFYIKMLVKNTQRKFQDQLVDALMVMSSSFRGGLSLVQAMEAVVEEMPDPVRGEFGLVLAENKMGVSLDDAMDHLYRRMPSVYLQQMITAVLLARETGGNLPLIFSRIVNNIRETKKIRQDLETMTIQGKIQGLVMTFLPIVFAMLVYSSNRRIFDNMLNSPMGQKLLIAAVILWVIGAVMIMRISTFDEF